MPRFFAGLALVASGCALMGGPTGPDCMGAHCCVNGTRSGLETDVDCGYMCDEKCTAGKHCVENKDCGWGLRCAGEELETRKCEPLDGASN